LGIFVVDEHIIFIPLVVLAQLQRIVDGSGVIIGVVVDFLFYGDPYEA
jgi:hypothetical protein